MIGIALLVLLLTRGGEKDAGQGPVLVPQEALPEFDPLAFDPDRVADYEESAAFGLSNVVYRLSPGGVQHTAERVDAFRPLIEDAVEGTELDPDLVEAIVFIESAGRPDVIAGGDPEAAAGLTQIVAETGTNLLDMSIDLAESRRLTRRIDRAQDARELERAEQLRERRRAVDPRFDPVQALAGTVTYLEIAGDRFGRQDLAVVSYHMGIGNLETVLRRYTGRRFDDLAIGQLVEDQDLSYARVYFDTSPRVKRRAWNRLNSLGDDSKNYYWKVLAAQEIMRLYREDPDELVRLNELHIAKNSAEEVLHPEEETTVFADPNQVDRAWSDRHLYTLPEGKRYRLETAEGMGELAAEVDAAPEIYRGLRAEALATLLYMADEVHRLSEDLALLVVSSTVRDLTYQEALRARNLQATPNYSLHTTGFAFDVERRYGSDAQAQAFQHVLERLSALGLVAWVREPGAIHVTVSADAERLVPFYLLEVEETE